MNFFTAVVDFAAYAILLFWVWTLDKRVANISIVVAHWITEEQAVKEEVEPDA